MVATASPVKDAKRIHVTHVIKGETRLGTETEYSSGGTRFLTPKLDLRELVWPRTEPGPAFDLKLDQGQSPGHRTKPARTGFNSTYRQTCRR